ncbi:MAG: hypothetical protein J7K94_00545 [Dehalococcoidia bacterium]|nr:hypothetical protein [Dehalococcoidia bacterium]
MPQLDANQNPVLQSRTQFSFTLLQGYSKSYYSHTGRNSPCKSATLQLIIDSLCQSLANIVGKNILHTHEAPLYRLIAHNYIIWGI